MTKPRAPISFALAVHQVADLIGYDVAARTVNRAERTVRYWSESDQKGTPTLDQALALDRAYQAAGGEGAPILESYTRQVEVGSLDSLASRAALVESIAVAVLENADAIAASVAVTQQGASPTAIHHAIAETEQSDAAIGRLLARLKSFLPGNGAGQGQSGDRK